MGPPDLPQPARFGDPRCTPAFWSKVTVADTGCWLWTGGLNKAGYGRLETADGSDRAHRVSYARLVGPIPEGLELDHLCRTRACIRPDHLQPVTHHQNVKRQAAVATSADPSRPVAKSGTVAGATASQHVDLFRKILLRRNLLAQAMPGAVYAPFIGDGDIAAELYADRTIYGADLDPQRVATAHSRLRGEIVIADCDGWPFPDLAEPIAVADIDAYGNPYKSLEAFWRAAPTMPRVVIFGTDGMRLGIKRWRSRTIGPLPAGEYDDTSSPPEKRTQYNFWWPRFVRPYLDALLTPAVVVDAAFYLRQHMLYWGIVVDKEGGKSAAGVRRGTADGDDPRDREVEDALFQAALAGNVAAIHTWLSARQPARWGGRQQSAVVPLSELATELGFDNLDAKA
jgi:hypothetical protein